MKRSMAFLFMTVCSLFLFSISADQLSDKIELGRLGGTTRMTDAASNSAYAVQLAEPIVEVEIHSSQNVITLSVQNYRGGVWVEIIGSRGTKQSYIEIYDMGFGVVNLSSLREGEYTLRVTVGSEVYTGTFNVTSYGG